MSSTILKLEGLSKRFRSHWTFRPIQAIKNVSLEVYRGESFGFLGHNGAGKTTTMKCIIGLIHKSSGRIVLDDRDLTSPEQRKSIGYLPEQPYFYDHLTVYETLDFFASLHNIRSPERQQRILSVLERVGLADRQKSPVRTLSKGLQQRLGLAQAIINEPSLLLLDEPFSGLDPIGRMDFRKIILDLKKGGTTIFLSSHILSDVEDICDRVSIMARGEMRAVFELADTPELFGQSFEVIVRGDLADERFLPQFSNVAASLKRQGTAQGEEIVFQFADYGTAQACAAAAIAGGLRLEQFKICGPSLEDIFMNITNDKAPSERTEQTEVKH